MFLTFLYSKANFIIKNKNYRIYYNNYLTKFGMSNDQMLKYEHSRVDCVIK